MPEASFDIGALLPLALRLGVAVLLTIPIGWEREVSSRSAGLRTFPLVALASCGYVVIALQMIGQDAEAQARVLQGLMTGIGFVGGGAILKERRVVHGTATAASIWTTGAIGAAVGYGRFEIAVLLAVVTLVILRVFYAVERNIDKRADGSIPDES